MTDLILHHYPSSPFSEKIRLVLGYKKLAWKSVIIPAIMPKPDVLALTGGYRKTPFLQVGADIYCDSALICDVLEHVKSEPTLYPPHLKGVSRVFAQWADTSLFWAAMGYNLQPKGAAHLFAKAPPEAAKAFGDDRKSMSANMIRLRPGDATSAYRSYLRRIAHMAEEHDYLFGVEPCVADFAAYHGLWYTRVQAPVMADILNATPAVGEWMDRMAAIGHGSFDKFSAGDAITVARGAEPMPPGQNLLIDSAFQNDHGIPLGTEVSITAETFGPEPTQGTLLAATRTHYTLRREDPRAGVVHVHFPRIGYVLRKAEGAYMAAGYCLFATAIGDCAIAWSETAILSVQLPESTAPGTIARMRRRLSDGNEAVPPEWVMTIIVRIQALLEGELDDLLDVPLAVDTVPDFHRRVYAVARAIPPGRTLTYGEVAQQLGEPGAARAVGQALGHNPFAPVVPCHRVLAARSGAGGFSAEGGVATKLRMLQIEKAQVGAEPGLFD